MNSVAHIGLAPTSAVLDQRVLDEVRTKLGDPDYLRQLAELHIGTSRAPTREMQYPASNGDSNDSTRNAPNSAATARNDPLHSNALENALAEVESERAVS